ncbi:hypothetical protein D3C76_1496520 [compost metagenome]
MMSCVGMQANPAILGAVVTGNRVPQGRCAPALRAQAGGEPERAQAAVNFNGRLLLKLALQQFGDCQATGGNAAAGKRGDGESRRQGAVAAKAQGIAQCRWQLQFGDKGVE